MLIRALLISLFIGTATSAKTIFVCSGQNDLYRNVRGEFSRSDSPDRAINSAADGDCVLVLADQYPQKTIRVSEQFWKTAHACPARDRAGGRV